MVQKNPSERPVQKWPWGITITVACIAAFVIFLSSLSPGTAQPPMARYNGKTFRDRGGYTLVLPEGAKYLGQTNYVRKSSSFESDLDCNVRGGGCLFTDSDDDGIVYFEFAAWDETVDSQTKYIILELIDE